jgi:hypothetical protein
MMNLGIFVDKLLKPILKDYSPTLLILNRNWSSIVGDKYREYCIPDKVIFVKNTKNNGILYIKVFNSVVSFYIDNNKKILIEKINTIFGYSMIKDIKLKQEPKIVK